MQASRLGEGKENSKGPEIGARRVGGCAEPRGVSIMGIRVGGGRSELGSRGVVRSRRARGMECRCR